LFFLPVVFVFIFYFLFVCLPALISERLLACWHAPLWSCQLCGLLAAGSLAYLSCPVQAVQQWASLQQRLVATCFITKSICLHLCVYLRLMSPSLYLCACACALCCAVRRCLLLASRAKTAPLLSTLPTCLWVYLGCPCFSQGRPWRRLSTLLWWSRCAVLCCAVSCCAVLWWGITAAGQVIDNLGENVQSFSRRGRSTSQCS
jgi:hypothetical protein